MISFAPTGSILSTQKPQDLPAAETVGENQLMPLLQPDESICRKVTVEFGREAFADQDPAYRCTSIPDDWLDAPAEADLRETALIREADRYTEGLLRRASMAALAPGDQFSLWVFLHSEDGQPFVMDRYGVTGRSVGNQPLEPLEDVQVVSSPHPRELLALRAHRPHGHPGLHALRVSRRVGREDSFNAPC
ncbi:hypothetical protein ABZ611_34740 [Streptomyces sp. NPDC007861]|uniref:hypothetical protein n=1 Tax=Streptomyces sp. NPDC007861 TaxID=3154893 RepID=UPI0033E3117A